MVHQGPHFAFLDKEGGKSLAFAHRGGDAAGAKKENTMAAFEAAVRLGSTHVETDVVLSADGRVVAIHGAKNEKQAPKVGLPPRDVLQALPYEEIRRRFKIDGEGIPLLAEILETWPDLRVNIDPKTPEVCGPLGKLLVAMRAVDRVGVGAFSYERTQAVAEEVPGGQERLCTALGPLGFIALKTDLAPGYLDHTQAACLQVAYRPSDLGLRSQRPMVGQSHVEIAHEAGLDVHVWTVNEEPAMRTALQAGVDGIMSDRIGELQAVIKEHWSTA